MAIPMPRNGGILLLVIGIVLSVLFATLPIFAYLFFIWWLDRYDREPMWLLMLTFAWGGMGGVVLAVIGSFALSLSMSAVFGIAGSDAMDTVFVAPVVEEITKGLFLLVIFARRDFDNTTDGVVYGAAAGLGFAASENFLYFISAWSDGGAGSWAQTVFLRTLFSGVMHAFATGMLGAALGYIKFARSTSLKFLMPIVGLGAAMGIHAFWNGSLVLAGAADSLAPVALGLVGVPVFGLALFVLTQISLWTESKTIALELKEECALGIIPESHLAILPSYLRRAGSGWLPPTVVKRRYVPLATTLAFRKFQRKRCPPAEVPGFDAEIASLRTQIRTVLNR